MTENRPPIEAPSGNLDDLTRRQWLLRFGELVTLAGISGLVPEFGVPLASQQGEDGVMTALPAGLYNASQDHLVHALSSGGKNWAPPLGSETEYVLPSSVPYQPLFFSIEEFSTVGRFIEILLGTVDPTALSQAAQWFDLWLFSAAGVRTAALHLDPLHRILAVAYYGEDSVCEQENSDPQPIARAGIRALHDLSIQAYGHDFLQLSEAEQVERVTSAGKSHPSTDPRTTDLRKFFDLAQAQAIRGYYTSAQGLKELDYRGNAYYGECPGCEGKSSA